MAGSTTYHQRTADVAGGRISHLDEFSERSNRIRTIGINRWLNGHRKGFEQFVLVAQLLEMLRQEVAKFDAAKNVQRVADNSVVASRHQLRQLFRL